MTKDYYAILEVSRDASYPDIKKAWRDKARQWHPDKFQTDSEKLAAHKTFVEILEAYSVLIDEKKRAAYDSAFAVGATQAYAGYESATPEQDQQEAADWFQKILDESPFEFLQSTVLVVIMCPVTLIIWLGVGGIVMAIHDVFMGTSSLGFGGIAMLIFLLFPNLFLALFGAVLLKDMYYRVKRIVMWIAMRARIKRLFTSLFGRKLGKGLRV